MLTKDIYHNSRNVAHSLTLKKKKEHVQEALQNKVGKPKELWKTLQGLGLKTTSKIPQNICLKTQDGISFDSKYNTNIFKNFFSNLADDLVKKLPNSKNIFGTDSVKAYYKTIVPRDKNFSLVYVTKEYTEKIALFNQHFKGSRH